MAVSGDLEYLGSGLGYRVGQLSSSYAFDCLSRALPAVLETVASVINEPTFADEEWERERSLQQSELRQHLDQTGAMAGYAYRCALYGNDHRYTWWTEGTPESLAALDVARCRAFFSQLTHPERMIFSVAGDVDPPSLARALEQLFPARSDSVRPVPLPSAPEMLRGARAQRLPSSKTQTGIFLGFPTVSQDAPERFGLLLLSTLCSGLAGRFGQVLRTERSLAYSVSAGSSLRSDGGHFYGFLSSDYRKEEEAIAGLRGEFARLHRDLEEDEVEAARSYLLGSYPLGRQHLSSRRGAMLSYTLLDRPLDYSEHYKEALAAVSFSEVKELVARFFVPGEEVLGMFCGGGDRS